MFGRGGGGRRPNLFRTSRRNDVEGATTTIGNIEINPSPRYLQPVCLGLKQLVRPLGCPCRVTSFHVRITSREATHTCKVGPILVFNCCEFCCFAGRGSGVNSTR